MVANTPNTPRDQELRDEVKLLQEATRDYLAHKRMTVPMLARKINISTSLLRNILHYRYQPSLHWLIRIAEGVGYDPLPLVIAHLKQDIGDELVARLTNSSCST